MVEYLGWVATAVFVGSYFCAAPGMLKRVQMLGALMWVAYGLLIGASPVVAANLLVFGAAAWTLNKSSEVQATFQQETRRQESKGPTVASSQPLGLC